ncbi:MAG: hypothetical protein AAGK05_10635 [Pseudomonadota bacterium]
MQTNDSLSTRQQRKKMSRDFPKRRHQNNQLSKKISQKKNEKNYKEKKTWGREELIHPL